MSPPRSRSATRPRPAKLAAGTDTLGPATRARAETPARTLSTPHPVSNMCSTVGVTDVGAPDPAGRPPGALPHGYGRGEGGQVRPVWVQLPVIFPGAAEHHGTDDARIVEAGSPPPVPAGRHGRLDLGGEVIGWLHHWERDRLGRWFGVVDYSVPLVDDFRPAKRVDWGWCPPRRFALVNSNPTTVHPATLPSPPVRRRVHG